MGAPVIERLYLKDYLSFDELELKFGNGLSVFTGVSGAGKSVLMGAILSVFGYKDSEARLIEADVECKLGLDEFGIEEDDINCFKLLKDKSTRYFINNQSISKKKLNLVASRHLKYLSARDITEFENSRLLNLLDILASKKSKNHNQNLIKFKEKFGEFLSVKKDLDKINEEEKKIDELRDFAKFEIEKIEQVSPKVGEFEELNAIKKSLSKKDKIEEAWSRDEAIFAYEKAVMDALHISEIDSGFFSDALNELKIARSSVDFDEFEGLDIEEILDRIESLNALIKRYGSIEECLEILKKRKSELAHYENIEFQKSDLVSKFTKLSNELKSSSEAITKERFKAIKELETMINSYLKDLYMDRIDMDLNSKNLDINGSDLVDINLNSSNLKTLSSGEINRLRLAFIASEAKISGLGGGVLILDEIDANLSGKEAMSIANVLIELSSLYQIFAISHQPQLSSKAHHHFLVQKSSKGSTAKELNIDERVMELSRMISGESITQEATEFAKKLLL